MKLSKPLIVLLLFFVCSLSVFQAHAGESQDVAASAVDGAETVLASAYVDVLGAERVGVDVSNLVASLNAAAELLVKARVAYVSEDFDQAVSFAGLCSEIGADVTRDTVELQIAAQTVQTTRFWLTVGGSLIGVAAVVVFGLLGWGYIKKRYFARVLQMKPEVGEDSKHQ